jgi:D-glycero-alpha-D-manno-heptose 1-phosphate guanylyltransferase
MASHATLESSYDGNSGAPALQDAALAGVTALILAGGLGTRLRSVVADRPKVLAEVDGVPFVFHLLRQLATAGVKHVVLAIGHRGEQVAGVVGSSYGPMRIEYSREPAPAGTGGALRRALSLLRSASVLVLNGDSYCELDLNHLWIWHHQRPAHGTLSVTRVADARRFGTVATGDDGRIVRFVEKSPASGPGIVNAGVYLLRRSLIAEIPPAVACSLENELLPRWLAAGIYGYPRTARFIDIGTPDSLAAARGFFRGATVRAHATGPRRNARRSRAHFNHTAEVA